MEEKVDSAQIRNLDISDEMRSSYLDYAMSVIASRALPDVRDGLKPVHRRVIYAMFEQGNTHQKAYRKSARVVGDVLGKYHPHSDGAVYDTIVRLAQDFTMREVLIDGHGNFGSMDGDSAAAMRYTEIRLAPLSQFLTDSLWEDTVDFLPNYDGSSKEPQVLPTIFPQLLVNGQQGIAVGMATTIPPHNLTEVLNALLILNDKPNASLEEVLEVLQGPDFPTFGKIVGREGLLEAYRTGKGKLTIQGEAEILLDEKTGKEKIIITELPFLVNKANLVLRIAECVRLQQITGISDLRDESNKEGVRIVIEIKRAFSAQTVLFQIYEKTRLQDYCYVNMVCLVGGIPRQVSLLEILQAFLAHRYEVIVRRARFRLQKALAREHLLRGLLVVVQSTDEVLLILKQATHTQMAKDQLVERFNLDDLQAQAILDLKLSRLTQVESQKILSELKEIQERIEKLRELLSSHLLVKAEAAEELKTLRDLYPRPRRTRILEEEFSRPDGGAFVNPASVLVTMTQNGFVKRMLEDELRSQGRATRGKRATGLKAEDVMILSVRTHTHDSLFFFTDWGRVFVLKTYDVPEGALRHRGVLAADLIKLKYGEKVCDMLAAADEQMKSDSFLVFFTTKGMVKKTSLTKYENAKQSGLIAIKITDSDRLLGVHFVSQEGHVLLVSRLGKAIHFLVSTVSETGRATLGVKGMKLGKKDSVVGGAVFQEGDEEILIVTEKGYGKRARLKDFRLTGRHTQGVMALKISEKTGEIAAVCALCDANMDIVLMTDKGRFLKLNKNEIRVYGRQAQGVRLIRLDEGEKIVSVGGSSEDDISAS